MKKLILSLICFIIVSYDVMAQSYCSEVAPGLQTMTARIPASSLFLNDNIVLEEDVYVYTLVMDADGEYVDCAGSTIYKNGGPATISINRKDAQTIGYSDNEAIHWVLEKDGCVYDSIVVNETAGETINFRSGKHINLQSIKAYRRASKFTISQPQCGMENGKISIVPGSGIHPFSIGWSQDDTLGEFSIDQLSPGEYSATVTDALGCSEILQFSLEDESVTPEVQIVSDTSFCKGDGIILNTENMVYEHEWKKDDEIISSNSSVEIAEEGVFVLTITNEDGCTNDYEINIVENELPQFDLGNDTLFCQGSELIISGPQGLSSYLWNDKSTESILEVNEEGDYSLEVTDDNGCIYKDSIFVDQIDQIPNILSISKEIGCVGDTIALFTEVGEDLEYKWNASAPLLEEMDNNALFILTEPTSVSLTISNVCFSKDLESEVDLFDITSNAQDTACFITGQEVRLTATGAEEYMWYVLDDNISISTPNEASTVLDMNKSDTIYIDMIDENGCMSSDQVFVEILSLNDDTFPLYNAISPNGDGKNDVLSFNFIHKFNTRKLDVFDRWGNVVYSDKEYDNNWNGVDMKGNNLSAGSYLYILTLDNNTFKSPLTIVYE